jgi:NTP pyrophosphatase (non-canonical NTP hydrolase)
MDLVELTAKMNQFVKDMGWYEPGSPKPQTSRNLAISLAMEASEILELYQWDEEIDDQQLLASELADVMLYLLQLASVNGLDLGTAVLEKLEENYGRTW